MPAPETRLKELADNPRTTEILFAVVQHEPALQRVDDPRPGAARLAADRSADATVWIEELWEELSHTTGDDRPRQALRWFRQREMLRIGYNDIVRGYPLEVVTLDLSRLADVCVEAATRLARRSAEDRHGAPLGREGQPAPSSCWRWANSAARS